MSRTADHIVGTVLGAIAIGLIAFLPPFPPVWIWAVWAIALIGSVAGCVAMFARGTGDWDELLTERSIIRRRLATKDYHPSERRNLINRLNEIDAEISHQGRTQQ